MGKVLLVLMLFFGSLRLLYAGQLNAPPPLPENNLVELSRSIQLYLRSVYENIHVPRTVTSNPNGSRRGIRGQVVYADFAGDQRICANVSTTAGGGTSWECVTLAAP